MRRSSPASSPAKLPARVASRPLPSQWNRSELLSLEEAAALFWPEGGPITVSTLRTAERDGALAVVRIAGKLFTTPGAIEDMTRCRSSKPDLIDVDSSTTETMSQAQHQPPAVSESAQALLTLIAVEKARLKPRSRRQGYK